MGRGGRQKEGVLVEGEGREEGGQEKGREGREEEGGGFGRRRREEEGGKKWVKRNFCVVTDGTTVSA